jgi:serine/threonine protein kinase
MSPEILQGKPYGLSVDIYTLGVLFYEILTGLPPHYSQDKFKMYNNISNNKVKIPAS